jgi:hypothetical protein
MNRSWLGKGGSDDSEPYSYRNSPNVGNRTVYRSHSSSNRRAIKVSSIPSAAPSVLQPFFNNPNMRRFSLSNDVCETPSSTRRHMRNVFAYPPPPIATLSTPDATTDNHYTMQTVSSTNETTTATSETYTGHEGLLANERIATARWTSVAPKGGGNANHPTDTLNGAWEEKEF